MVDTSNKTRSGCATSTQSGLQLPAVRRATKSTARTVSRAAKAATRTTEAVATAPVVRPTNDVLAGGLARSAAQATIHPIDTVKVRMQMMINKAKLSGVPAAGPPATTTTSASGKYAPAVSSPASKVASLSSLYKGCGSAAVGAGIAIGTYFWFYNNAKRLMQENCPEAPSSVVAFIAGAMGALGSSVVKVPAAVCIRSVQAGVYPNGIAAFSRILKVTGPRGLYTGYLPTVLEDVPDMAFKFAAYETVGRAYFKAVGKTRAEANRIDDLVCGGVSGAIAAAATTPLDVIKTRMMCAAGAAGVRPTMLQVIRGVAAEGKLASWFTGVGPRALSSGVNSAVFFMFLETLRGWQADHEERRLRALSRPRVATVGESSALGTAPPRGVATASLTQSVFTETKNERTKCVD